MFKRLIIITILFCLLVNPAWATNTHTIDLARASFKYFSRAYADLSGLPTTGDFSIMAWVKLDSLPSVANDHFQIVNYIDVGQTNGGYYFRIQKSDNAFGVYFMGASSNGARSYSDDVFDADDLGDWIHIAAVVDLDAAEADKFTFYKNGQVTTDTVGVDNTDAMLDGQDEFLVGGRELAGGHDDFFDGDIDDVRVYNDLLTSEEIADYWDCSLTGADGEPDNLGGHWIFDNSATDSSGNGNTLTANGGAGYQSGSLPYTDTCGAAPPAEEATIIKIPPQMIIN